MAFSWKCEWKQGRVRRGVFTQNQKRNGAAATASALTNYGLLMEVRMEARPSSSWSVHPEPKTKRSRRHGVGIDKLWPSHGSANGSKAEFVVECSPRTKNETEPPPRRRH